MTDPHTTESGPPVDVDRDGQAHVQPTQTRGASKEGVVRWVLIASMLLIVVFLILIVFVFKGP